MKWAPGKKHVAADDEAGGTEDKNSGGTEDETELEDDIFQKPTIYIKNTYTLRNRSDSIASAKASAKSTGPTRAAGRSSTQSSSCKQLPLQGKKHAASLHSTPAKKSRTDTGQRVDPMMVQKLTYHHERLAESGPYKCTVERPEDKYDYLLKKDWDKNPKKLQKITEHFQGLGCQNYLLGQKKMFLLTQTIMKTQHKTSVWQDEK